MSPRLSDICSMIEGSELIGSDSEIREITLDSRDVRPAWLFCAVKGTRFDGHLFVKEAERNGAGGLLVSRPVETSLPYIIVPSVRHALGPISSFLHSHPSQKLNLIGITGTNGKTTTSYLLDSALSASGLRCGLIGTIEARLGNSHLPSMYTTPEAPEFHRYMAETVELGTEYLVMEVSSHGLDQHRVDGSRFKIGIFTNLSPEHLDYHGTIEQYYYTKSLLFDPARCELGLICIDDEWGERLASQANIPVITFGNNPAAQLKISDVQVSNAGTSMKLSGMGLDTELMISIVGACNAANAAGAYLAARVLGISEEDSRKGIESCHEISGRFQQIDLGQDFLVVVDYAHTPDSIRALIATARTLIGEDGHVTLVAGARGKRDRLKRPELGRAAATADLAILTTDNPGDEDPRAIVDQLISGTFDVSKKNLRIQLDRAKAIQEAIFQSQQGDAVLIVGRGHETHLRVGSNLVYLDDREAAAAALRAKIQISTKAG